MELKQWNDGVNPSGISLLIVPYGIETVLRIEGDNLNGDLLIVPYGIETYKLGICFAEMFLF